MREEDFRAGVSDELIRMLSNARRAQGLSMNRLAKLSGVTQPAISILESSKRNPKLDSLLRISRALGLNLGEILAQAIRNVERHGRSVAPRRSNEKE